MRLNADGSFDSSFSLFTAQSGSSSLPPRFMDVQSDGSLLIAGDYTFVNSIEQRYLSVIESDGSLRESFDPTLRPIVSTTPQGFRPPPVSEIVRLPNGKLVVAGNLGGLSFEYPFLVRFEENGEIAETFFDAQIDGRVTAAAVDVEGNLLIGGLFDTVGGVQTGQVARLAIGLDLRSNCYVVKAQNGNVVSFCL